MMSRKRTLSLIEVVLSIAVLGLVLAYVLAVFSQGQLFLRKNTLDITGAFLAQEKMEEFSSDDNIAYHCPTHPSYISAYPGRHNAWVPGGAWVWHHGHWVWDPDASTYCNTTLVKYGFPPTGEARALVNGFPGFYREVAVTSPCSIPGQSATVNAAAACVAVTVDWTGQKGQTRNYIMRTVVADTPE
jgi:type II secretory pathway pseudopilin PulG